MTILSLVIEDEFVQRACKRALDEGTTIDALVNEYLKGFVHRADVEAMRKFVEEAASFGARSDGPWTREELHDR